MDKTKKHICLVDGSTYIFRAYHALPPLTRKSDGFPVGAIAGFCNMLDKLVKEEKEKKAITNLLVVFDASGKTFRNNIYPKSLDIFKLFKNLSISEKRSNGMKGSDGIIA